MLRHRLTAFAIQRAAHASGALAHDVGIDHGRIEICVTEQFLHRADVGTILEQVRREAAWSALLGGPSTSPLEAMTRRTAVVAAAMIVSGGLAWILVPPFPRPETLLSSSLPALTKQFGPPDQIMRKLTSDKRSVTSVAWVTSRGIAFWTLQVDWSASLVNPTARPEGVSRCLRPRLLPEWVGVVLFLPCGAAVNGRVMASNNAWSGRER